MENPDEERRFIPPDYSEEMKNFDDMVNEIEVDDSDDGISTVDEGATETILDNQDNEQKENNTNNFINNNNNMGTFGDSSPSWGGMGGSTPSWGSPSTGGSVPFWQTQKQTGWGFGGGGPSSWGSPTSAGQRMEIDRKKKVVFCDFLDVLVTTWDQNARPGLPPRDIYDLRPRFDVWDKIAAFNPERVFAAVQKNLIPTTNGSTGWELTLSYFCCCLSSYIKVPYTNCQVFSQNIIGQPKEDVLRLLINNESNPIKREDIIYIGIYSGVNGQSDRDIHAANVCGVDYVDLTQLLTNMY